MKYLWADFRCFFVLFGLHLDVSRMNHSMVGSVYTVHFVVVGDLVDLSAMRFDF